MKSVVRIARDVGIAVVGAAMMIVCGLVTFLYVVCVSESCKWSSVEQRPHFAIAACIMVVVMIGIWTLLTLVFWRKKLDQKGRVRGSILGVLVLFLLYLVIDDAQPTPQFTRADIPPPAGAEESYEVLMKFREEGGIKLQVELPYATNSGGYPRGFPSNVLAHAGAIEEAWRGVGAGWAVIEELDAFDAIADITANTPIDRTTPVMGFLVYRTMGRACSRYAVLKTEQGEPEEGVAKLCQLDSVTRKALRHATVLLHKMIWIAVAEDNLRTADRIARSPKCTRAALRTMMEHFVPLTAEDVLVRRTMIAEYIYAWHCHSEWLTGTNFLDTMFYGEAKFANSWSGRTISRIAYRAGYNRNRVLKDMGKHYALLVAGHETLPPDMLVAREAMEKYENTPRLKNVGGRYLVGVTVPAFMKVGQTVTKTKVLSDLVAMELHRRVGKDLALADPWTGKPYLRDEKSGELFGVGPDGKAGTTDDIKLGEWPR